MRAPPCRHPPGLSVIRWPGSSAGYGLADRRSVLEMVLESLEIRFPGLSPDAIQLASLEDQLYRPAYPNDTLNTSFLSTKKPNPVKILFASDDAIFLAEQKETMSALFLSKPKSRHGLRESFALAKACVIRLNFFYLYGLFDTINFSSQKIILPVRFSRL